MTETQLGLTGEFTGSCDHRVQGLAGPGASKDITKSVCPSEFSFLQVFALQQAFSSKWPGDCQLCGSFYQFYQSPLLILLKFSCE